MSREDLNMIMRRTYRDVIDDARANLTAELPSPGAWSSGGTEPKPPLALRKLGRRWQAVDVLLDQIEVQLEAVGKRVWRVYSEHDPQRYTDQHRTEAVQAVVQAGTVKINAVRDEAVAGLRALLDQARSAALPARPAATDPALQEQQIAGIKAELQMLIGNTGSAEELNGRLLSYLGRAFANGDALRMYVVAGSDWPLTAVESRGWDKVTTDGARELWTGALDQFLNDSGDADLSEVREAYRVIASPQHGAQSIMTILGGWFDRVLDELAGQTAA